MTPPVSDGFFVSARSSGIETEETDMRIEGLWLPLITPFHDGELDEPSLRRLAQHYLAQPVDGLILAATTGEGLTLDDDETARLVEIVAAEVARRIPIFLGVSGSFTRKVAATLAETAAWPVDGYLIACPYYTRPSQEGLYRHFAALADATQRPIIVYNIPYRTGVNLLNDTLLRLAALPNIVGVKDCCADQVQSFDLAAAKPRRLCHDDRGGRTVLQRPHARSGGRDPGGIACRDRGLRVGAKYLHQRRPAGCATRLARAGRPAAAVVRRAEPGADQALALARRPDRQPGGAPADDAGQRYARGAHRTGDRAASAAGRMTDRRPGSVDINGQIGDCRPS